MRLALLLVLASLSASAAEPAHCYAEESAVRSMRVYLAAAKARAEDAANGTAEEMHAAHMEIVAARLRLEAVMKDLKKCRAAKAVKP